jgi:hypothetical protein
LHFGDSVLPFDADVPSFSRCGVPHPENLLDADRGYRVIHDFPVSATSSILQHRGRCLIRSGVNTGE